MSVELESYHGAELPLTPGPCALCRRIPSMRAGSLSSTIHLSLMTSAGLVCTTGAHDLAYVF